MHMCKLQIGTYSLHVYSSALKFGKSWPPKPKAGIWRAHLLQSHHCVALPYNSTSHLLRPSECPSCEQYANWFGLKIIQGGICRFKRVLFISHRTALAWDYFWHANCLLDIMTISSLFWSWRIISGDCTGGLYLVIWDTVIVRNVLQVASVPSSRSGAEVGERCPLPSAVNGRGALPALFQAKPARFHV